MNLFFKRLFLSTLTLFSTLSANPLIEIKAGYFFFSDSKMQKIYDKDGFDIQLAASYPLSDINCQWSISAYGAVEYFKRSGKSINGHQTTSLWSVPVNIGLKQVFTINDNLSWYFTLGPRYFYIHQHNHSSYVAKNRSKNGVGGFINTGLNYTIFDCLSIDIFGECSYAKVRFHSSSTTYTRNIQIGGTTFGGGLSYDF